MHLGPDKERSPRHADNKQQPRALLPQQNITTGDFRFVRRFSAALLSQLGPAPLQPLKSGLLQ